MRGACLFELTFESHLLRSRWNPMVTYRRPTTAVSSTSRLDCLVKRLGLERHFFSPAAFSARYRAHRASTAFRPASLSFSLPSLAALAGPPFKPPLRPRATAAWFLRFFAMNFLYVSGPEESRKYLLTIRERSRIVLSCLTTPLLGWTGAGKEGSFSRETSGSRLAKVPVDDVMAWRYPPPSACAFCGHKKA